MHRTDCGDGWLGDEILDGLDRSAARISKFIKSDRDSPTLSGPGLDRHPPYPLALVPLSSLPFFRPVTPRRP